jgi:hypothetical protein
MLARHLLNRLMLAGMALCLLIISLWGSVSQVMPVAAADYRTSKDLAPPPILAANPANFRGANHCSGNQNQGWLCGTTLTNENSKRSLNWSTSGRGINRITFYPPSGTLPPNGGMQVVVRVPPTNCPASATFFFTGPANTVSAPWSCLSLSPTPTPPPSPSPTPTLVPSPTLSPSPSPDLSPTLLPSPSPHTQSTPVSTANGTGSNDGSGGSSAGIFITFIAFLLAVLAFLLYLLPARRSPAALLKRALALFVPTSFLR